MNCRHCDIALIPYVNQFPANVRDRRAICKACVSAQCKRWRKLNPERLRELGSLRNWKAVGIDCTWDEYPTKFDRQNGRCAICNRPGGKKGLHLDHNHRTKQVRDLLCTKYNTALGPFESESTAAYLAYLKKWSINA